MTRTAAKLLRVVLAAAFALAASQAIAGKVLLRVRAGNPIEKPQTVPIKCNLPAGVGPSDVLDLGGLELGYDVKNDLYYVHRSVELGPKETVIFDVQINDVWVIAPEEIAKIGQRAKDLTQRLAAYPQYYEQATQLRDEIDRNLQLVGDYQDKNSIRAGVKTVDHIRAFEQNAKMLTRIRRDLGRIENLVLGTGQDPGELIGEVKPIPKEKGEVELPPENYGVAVIRLTVQNTSPTVARKVNIKRDLPPEIKAYDVMDSGGLDLGTDPKTGVTYVEKADVEVAPTQTLTFDVKIRDKWNIYGRRLDALLVSGRELEARMQGRAGFASIQQTVRALIADLEAVRAEKGPTELNEGYVAFYRQQGARLDAVEQKLYRIESAMRPIETTAKYGFNVKPPSPKTTWLIIWIILGFLGVMSLLFFLRWYGKGKAESMGGGPAAPPSSSAGGSPGSGQAV